MRLAYVLCWLKFIYIIFIIIIILIIILILFFLQKCKLCILYGVSDWEVKIKSAVHLTLFVSVFLLYCRWFLSQYKKKLYIKYELCILAELKAKEQ